jgi:hypothetical protein
VYIRCIADGVVARVMLTIVTDEALARAALALHEILSTYPIDLSLSNHGT